MVDTVYITPKTDKVYKPLIPKDTYVPPVKAEIKDFLDLLYRNGEPQPDNAADSSALVNLGQRSSAFFNEFHPSFSTNPKMYDEYGQFRTESKEIQKKMKRRKELADLEDLNTNKYGHDNMLVGNLNLQNLLKATRITKDYLDGRSVSEDIGAGYTGNLDMSQKETDPSVAKSVFNPSLVELGRQAISKLATGSKGDENKNNIEGFEALFNRIQTKEAIKGFFSFPDSRFNEREVKLIERLSNVSKPGETNAPTAYRELVNSLTKIVGYEAAKRNPTVKKLMEETINLQDANEKPSENSSFAYRAYEKALLKAYEKNLLKTNLAVQHLLTASKDQLKDSHIPNFGIPYHYNDSLGEETDIGTREITPSQFEKLLEDDKTLANLFINPAWETKAYPRFGDNILSNIPITPTDTTPTKTGNSLGIARQPRVTLD